MKTEHPARRERPFTADGEAPTIAKPVYEEQPLSASAVADEPDHAPEPEPIAEPAPAAAYWDEMSTAPLDGSDIVIRYDEADLNGRPAKWKRGRRFDGRRWTDGGRWVSGDLAPLPAAEPIQWLRPANYGLPTAEAVDEPAEAAA